MRDMSKVFKFLFFWCGIIFGQTNPGFETGDLTGWTDKGTGTETVDTIHARTGTYALSYATDNSINQRMENDFGFIIPNNSYLHVVAWVRGSNADAKATVSINDGSGWSSKAIDSIGTTLTKLIWERQNTSGLTDTGYIGVTSRKATNATILYWDDVVAYVSTSATTDTIAPNVASNITTTSNVAGSTITVSWTDGTDTETGSQKVIILRADGLGQTPPTLNDQAQYSIGNTVGSWTVKGIVDVGTQTFDDNTVSANTAYTYAVFMADLAYNYSSGASSSVTSLPVELTSFTAVAKGRGVELAWQTATEVNNYGFEIERMTPSQTLPLQGGGRGGGWNKIGFVEGAGNSNSPKSYSFVDASASGKVAYRLKQIDRDGKFEYSNTVEVLAATPKAFALMQNHPNPFNPSTKISYDLPAAGFVSLKVYDMLGKEVVTLVNGMQEAGAKIAEFNASQLPSGIYFYTLRTQNFNATKKMLMIK